MRGLTRKGVTLFALCATAVANPVCAAGDCDMNLTDNTFGGGLDIDDVSRDTLDKIRTVERYHFTPEVAALRSGINSPLPGDIVYTLRHIPNHYDALLAYSRWEQKNASAALAQPRTAECYFRRAMAFRPKDATLRAVFAVVLHRIRRFDEARAEYQAAEEMGLESADLFYNRGLLELDAGDLKAARAYADRAYALGHPLPGLRARLERAEAVKER